MRTGNRCAIGIVVCLPALSLAQSVFDGTWKADMDKNKRTESPDVFVLTAGAYECQSCRPPYKIKADGQDHPVSGSSFYDTISVRIVDDHTVVKTAKQAGRTVADVNVVISPDGNTQTSQSTITGMGPEPVKLTQEFARVSPGPRRSHAISGTWQQTRTEGSDNVDVTTFKVNGDMFSMSSKTGESYTANLDGTDAPFKGRPGITAVSVRKVDDHTIEEAWKNGDRVVMRTRWWVDPDGQTMHARFDNTHGAVLEQTGHKVP